ncbi:MAG: hypothetical protein KAY48_03785 [Saprospiraceae bacterium]|nr:hypothetical protein [Saprospiraceae bacterium]
MYRLYILIAALAMGCNSRPQINQTPGNTDTVKVEKPAPSPPASVKTYTNERFKDVVVQRTGDHSFLVTGQGQIFEASFSWVVEDGHDELLKGHQMTDAGAPAWGNFSFTIDVQKDQENSTLTLILFESSPKDGSRQYELPVVLY